MKLALERNRERRRVWGNKDRYFSFCTIEQILAPTLVEFKSLQKYAELFLIFNLI